MPVLARRLAAAATVLTISAMFLAESAQAQIPPPPAVIYGSITDAEGDVPEGIPVEAIVNNNVCGTTETMYYGEGSSRVTVYTVDVIAHGQREGCGRPGDAIRIRIGDRLASGTVPWETGSPIRKDIVFGDVAPAPIPTHTPTPAGGSPPTSTPNQQSAATEATATPGESTPQTTDQADETPAPTDDEDTDGQPGAVTDDSDATPEPTLDGQLTSSTPAEEGVAGASGGDGGGGFPVWAVLLLVVGGIAVAGGGLGYMMARGTRRSADGIEGDEAFAYGDGSYEDGDYGDETFDDDDSYAGDADFDFSDDPESGRL